MFDALKDESISARTSSSNLSLIYYVQFIQFVVRVLDPSSNAQLGTDIFETEALPWSWPPNANMVILFLSITPPILGTYLTITLRNYGYDAGYNIFQISVTWKEDVMNFLQTQASTRIEKLNATSRLFTQTDTSYRSSGNIGKLGLTRLSTMASLWYTNIQDSCTLSSHVLIF